MLRVPPSTSKALLSKSPAAPSRTVKVVSSLVELVSLPSSGASFVPLMVIVSVAVLVLPSASVIVYVYTSSSVSPSLSAFTALFVLSSVYVYVPSAFSTSAPYVRSPVQAVTAPAAAGPSPPISSATSPVPAPVVPNTLPVASGAVSSVTLAASALACGRLSVMYTSSVSLPSTPLTSFTTTGMLSRIGALFVFVCTFGS